MASRLLLPGIGGVYTSETFAATATGADTLDCSRCAQLMIIETGTGQATIQPQTSDSVSGPWQSLGSAITVTSNGSVTRYDVTDGPFGVLRLSVTIIAGSVGAVRIVGYEMQRES